ncbi:MAG TPA: hypothetical protein PK566_18330 [Pseudobacteroides sp.]|nr:hypothetical protein [Pseudobacteroides sp.]
MNNMGEFGTSRVYRHQTSNEWVIEGRAYNDIYVGDIFSTQVNKLDKKSETIYLKLISIITYRKDIDFLGSGMTGALYTTCIHDLKDMMVETLNMYEPCFETRKRICIEILDGCIDDVPKEIKMRIREINNLGFFSEFMQFSYKYKSVKNIEELIRKWKG